MKHKRISRAGISLLLVLCMVLSICPLTAFAKEDELNLVSLGASNVNGYGLRGYLKATGYDDDNAVMEDAALNSELKKNANVLGYNQAPAGSYPALLQEALSKQQGNTVNLSQLAISSMRAEELRILLDNNYNGDAYSAWRFIGEGNWFDIADGKKDGKFEQLREEYQTAVKKADLITVDIGANNFGVYLSQMLTNNFKSGNDLNLVDPQIGKLYNGAKAEVNALLAEYGISVEDYAELADTLVYALVGFCYNFDKSVERIYELNPDATVVVVSIQNLMAGLGAKLGDVEVPLGDIIGALINTANTYIAIGSPYSSKYLCADVRQNGRVEFFIDKMAAYDGNIETIDKNIIDCFNVYDGNPKDSYDKGFHVKYQVAQMLITAGGDFSWIDTLDKAKVFLETDNGKALLNKVYDAYAQILSAGAKINTLDLATLDQLDKFKSIQSALEAAIGTAITTAATSTDPYTLPANFFSDIANSCGVSESVVKTVAAMAVRTDIGNSFFSHPTPDGHQKVADAILATLANKTTGEDIIKNEIEIAGEQLYRFAYDHGAVSLVKVVDFVVGEGYITAEQAAALDALIAAADKALKTGDTEKLLAVCEKIANDLYAYAVANGYVPEEVQKAIVEICKVYEEIKNTTNDVVSISVTSAPTKTSYIAGQNFDSTGMAITATYYDGSTAIVEGWSVTDGNNLPAGKTSVTISYTEGGVTKTTSQAITVAAKTLSSISVKTAPTKTSYIAGQNFDSTGMVIEKKYNDNSTATAIGWTVTDGNNLPAGKTSVTISYTEGGVTKTITQAITVNSSNPGPGPGGGGGGAASYAVSAATATHGKVTVDKTSASAGDTVTITVVPEKGFTLETLTVKDAKGNEVALTAVKTGETYTFKMPAGKVTVSATFMEDNTMLNFFVDVPATEYYYDAVLWAAKNGITLGVDDTHFAPMAIATRGQMVTFLWRAAGCPEPTSTTCAFTDVKTSEYYYKAVLWAVETGITKGTSDTTFSPDAEVSRGQTVTFLARMSGVKDDETGYSHNFADVKTTDYYNNAVAWAATNKITEGTSATTFSPNDDCLRGQIVTFLYRNFVK